MTTFKDRILAPLDRIRGIPGKLGLHPYSVLEVQTITYSGGRIGEGTRTVATVALAVAFGTQPPKVRQVTQEDVLRSGGIYEKEDLEIGPVTPAFVGGGYQYAQLDPPATGALIEVLYRIVGPGTQPAGDWFVKVGAQQDSALHYNITVRKTSAYPNG